MDYLEQEAAGGSGLVLPEKIAYGTRLLRWRNLEKTLRITGKWLTFLPPAHEVSVKF